MMFENNHPYYIALGDSHELIKSIPDHSVDFILTDPPYNLAQHSTGNIPLPGRSAMNNDLAPWDLIEFKPEEWIDEFLRILKPTGNLFIFTSYNQIGKWYELLDHKFDATNFMVWHKTNPAPKIFKAGFLNSCELIYTCWNKGHTWNFINQAEMHNFIESSICMRPERLQNPKHPTQKPVSVLKKLITIASNENDIVFDPFMGVGSTGVAALDLGRKFIGFEINPEYFQASELRIKNANMQLSLFEAQAKEKQQVSKHNELKPIIKWPGGKEKELPHIKLHAPQFFENYYEPFVGGGSVFTAFDAKHLFINDKSDELISLYRYISTQDAQFFSWLDAITQAWEATLNYIAHHMELCEWYKQFRNDEIEEILMKGKLHMFVKAEAQQFEALLSDDFEWHRNTFYKEIDKSLSHKAVRMKKIESERQQMPEQDIFDNIETAFMSALYTYLRTLYNDKDLCKEQPHLATALFVFLRNYAYSGMFRYNDKGEFNVPYGGISYNHKLMQSKVEYYHSSELLAHLRKTTIANLDFEAFFHQYPPTEKDFVFLDPPYDTEFSTYAQNEFAQADQRRLADFLCNECKAKWQMIIKYTPFIYDLYNREGIFIQKFDKKYLVSFMNRNDKDVEHLIITNYKDKFD
ncbi:MAG: DNA adenine methylase [Paludibacteraceae bacterium]|nr:DNA adenine methylase [Paludibacteraceae bacterium]